MSLSDNDIKLAMHYLQCIQQYLQRLINCLEKAEIGASKLREALNDLAYGKAELGTYCSDY